MLGQILMTVCTVILNAAPKVPPRAPEPVAVVFPESASVLLAEAPIPDGKMLVGAYNKLTGAGAALVADEKGGTRIALPGLGVASVRLEKSALANAELAFKRGITSLISDEVLAPHVAQWVIDLVPDAGVARLAAVDALAQLATIACQQNASAVGVYFAAGRVAQPATYVLAAARDKLPRGWLWVGFELGGTTAELHFASIGLAKAGLMELELVTQRRDVGAAIETFFQLVMLALGRDKDFPDGFAIARTDSTPLAVKHVDGAAGAKLWRVDYVPAMSP